MLNVLQLFLLTTKQPDTSAFFGWKGRGYRHLRGQPPIRAYSNLNHGLMQFELFYSSMAYVFSVLIVVASMLLPTNVAHRPVIHSTFSQFSDLSIDIIRFFIPFCYSC